MSTFALALVVVAALAHAAWNVLAKTAAGGATFVWLFSTLAAVLWLPVAGGGVARRPGPSRRAGGHRLHGRQRRAPRPVLRAAAARLPRGRPVARLPPRARDRP